MKHGWGVGDGGPPGWGRGLFRVRIFCFLLFMLSPLFKARIVPIRTVGDNLVDAGFLFLLIALLIAAGDCFLRGIAKWAAKMCFFFGFGYFLSLLCRRCLFRFLVWSQVG